MTIMKLIAILIAIESGGNQNAINMKENACGVLQIRPVMIDEVNRIVKLFGGECVFYQEDCFNRGLSIRMCSMFLEHQKERYIKKYGRKPSDLELALSWQSGGIFNKPSEKYRRKLIKRGVK
jgi:hypothetical protein